MKVTFTCEKCGMQVGCPITGVPDGFAVPLPYHECKLTYGPLTEEMVAEALYEAVDERSWSQGDDADRMKARFVLRLLNELDDTRIEYESTWPDEWFSGPPVESWLLKLAREK